MSRRARNRRDKRQPIPDFDQPANCGLFSARLLNHWLRN